MKRLRSDAPMTYCTTYVNRKGQHRAEITLNLADLGRVLADDRYLMRFVAEVSDQLGAHAEAYLAECAAAADADVDPTACAHPERAMTLRRGLPHCRACSRDLPIEGVA